MSTIQSLSVALVLLVLGACAPASPRPPAGPADAAASSPASAPVSASSAAPGGQPRRGGTLVVGQEDGPSGLDPHLFTATPFVSQMIFEHLYSGLLRLDPDLQPRPDLAERWETSDYQTFVFHLRRGVKFHNGRELVADDVVYSLDRMMDPAKNDRPRMWLRETSFQSLDPYTVQVVLPRPDAAFLVRLASPESAIVPREAVEQHGNLQQVAVGTGPFRLAEEVPGVHIRLERHPEYYLPDRPYLDGILFKIITDESTRLANIRSGDVDFTRFYDPKHARVLGNNADATVIEGPSLTRELLRINVTRPPLDDARVRQALSLAINRDELVRAAIFGVGTTTGPIAPALKDWAVPVTSLPYLQYDSARARELLAAAGHASGLNLTIKTSRPQSIAAAQIIQRHLKAVGVEVEILPLEWGVFNRDIRRQEYDLAIHALLSEPDPDVYFAQVYKTGSVLNVSGYSNPRVDALIERGVSTGDRAQRKAIYDELQRLVDEEAPTPTLFTQNRVDVVRKTVKGYAQIPNGSRITYRDTWLER